MHIILEYTIDEWQYMCAHHIVIMETIQYALSNETLTHLVLHSALRQNISASLPALKNALAADYYFIECAGERKPVNPRDFNTKLRTASSPSPSCHEILEEVYYLDAWQCNQTAIVIITQENAAARTAQIVFETRQLAEEFRPPTWLIPKPGHSTK